MRPIIVGNWKMHGLSAKLKDIETLSAWAVGRRPSADVIVCLPATLIEHAARIAAGRIGIGGEDCHVGTSGPFTGDISAAMLKNVGASAVIVGHSERRQHHGETNAVVLAKARDARRAELLAIICVGETKAQRDDGRALSVCGEQIAGSVPEDATSSSIVVGYEPLWAIGSGVMPTMQQITQAHAHIRHCLCTRLGPEGRTVRILYGGSVKPSNAVEILGASDVGGALVGGASLIPDDFEAIIQAAAVQHSGAAPPSSGNRV
jgi:triosephosphate isomerase